MCAITSSKQTVEQPLVSLYNVTDGSQGYYKDTKIQVRLSRAKGLAN